MAAVEVLVEVQLEGAIDLQTLLEQTNSKSIAHESRALDGDTVLAAIVTITAGGLGVLRTWIRAQTEQHKAFTVRLNGRTFKGYSARDVEQLVAALDAAIRSDEEDEEIDTGSSPSNSTPDA